MMYILTYHDSTPLHSYNAFLIFINLGFVLTAASCFCGNKGLRDCSEHNSDLLITLPTRSENNSVTVGIGFSDEFEDKKPIVDFRARLITIYEGYKDEGTDGDLAVVELESEHGIPK